ncbi:MAG: cell division protein ZapB [Chitinispirillaceae bacterium]|nr:cell division protein ZapB [Chitinispirillaceae bacterium]
MSIDILNELENKIDTVLEKVDHLREENNRLKGEINTSNKKTATLEEGLRVKNEECTALKSSSEKDQEKLKKVTEKIQGLLEKIEAQ